MARFYVTTPIYYVNAAPHVGTAYTTIVADALRRYHALRGEASRMLTGTDEHGLKIERVAQERGVSPQAFADEVSVAFRDLLPALSCQADDFIRTTEPRHKAFVQDLWRKIEAKGDLYEGDYEEWYCVGCESYKTEKELVQPGNICPLHLKPVERVKERTFFFRLSRFEKPLLELYARRPDFIAPRERRNEVISFVEGGLRDLSVSRTSFKWGIPVPGRPEHVMYVWFDALSNYVSALAHGPQGEDAMSFWPRAGGDAFATHLVGKDILRFHAVYWPAFLLAAGYTDDELPSQVFAHGFLTVDGQKMSKALGNVVDPVHVAREVGADVLRYHLLRAISFGQDGDFDHHALVERYNADLGKNLGNLLNRVLGLSAKMTGSRVGATWAPTSLEEQLLATARTLADTAAREWLDTAPHRALEATWAIASAANQYVDQAAPWSAVKQEGGQARVETILRALLTVLGGLSVLAWPAIPTKSNAMRAQLGLAPLTVAPGADPWAHAFDLRPGGEPLTAGAPLFPTYDKDATTALLARLVPKRLEQPALAAGAASTGANVVRAGTETNAGGGRPEAGGAPPAPITYEQFAAVELTVGVVKTAERVPKKDKLLSLTVDIGEAAPRAIVAGLALSFAPDQLVGRRVIVVSNLAARAFGKGLESHGMLLATGASDALVLPTIDESVPPGTRLK